MLQSTEPIETPGRRNARRLALFAYIAIALLAFLPAVLTPFFLDDHLHASMVEGSFPVARSPFELGAYSRWREDGSGRHALYATILFALALLGGGEYALCFGGYVLAIDRIRKDEDGIAKRLVGLAPFALPAASYLWVRGHLG